MVRGRGSGVKAVTFRLRIHVDQGQMCLACVAAVRQHRSGAVKLVSWSPSFGTAFDGGNITQQRRLSTYDYRNLRIFFCQRLLEINCTDIRKGLTVVT
jgi:hypothetical protein